MKKIVSFESEADTNSGRCNKLTFPGNYYFFLPVTCRFLRNNIFGTETPARGVHDRAPVWSHLLAIAIEQIHVVSGFVYLRYKQISS